MKERATFVKDIYEEGKFFFEAPQSFDEKAVKKAWKEDTHEVMSVLLTVLEAISFDTETIKNAIHDFATEKSLGMGKVMMPLRLALVGELKGPDVPDLMTIIGKEESLNRLKKALEVLK